MKIKKLTYAAILLAICIVSMFLKNANVYFTGSIVNACIILATFFSGLAYGIILAIFTPIFSFIVTGSPIIAAIPFIMPMIMIGNVILVMFGSLVDVKGKTSIVPLIIGSILKGIFMGISISLIIVPLFLPEKMNNMLPIIRMTFSVVQLVTALIGSIIATILAKVIMKLEKGQ